MADKGTCKKHNLTFVLEDGCAECLAERRQAGISPEQDEMEDGLNAEGLTLSGASNIVKVRYYSETANEVSNREYTYFTEDQLQVGDVVMVPVRDRMGKAKVSAINVPDAEIEKFRDKVKTIPAGSIGTTRKELEQIDVMAEDAEAVDYSPHAFPPDPNAWKGGEEEARTESDTNTAVLKVNPGAEATIMALADEANRALTYAETRIINSLDTLQEAVKDLSLMAGLKKQMEAKKQEYVSPIREQLDKVMWAFKQFMGPLEQADQITRSKRKEYQLEVARQRQVAEAIEAEKLALAQREAELNQGEITVDLTPVVKPSPITGPVRTDVGSSGLVDHWKAEVVDFAVLDDAYKMENWPAINAAARTCKDQRAVPGLRIFNDPDVRVNARKGG